MINMKRKASQSSSPTGHEEQKCVRKTEKEEKEEEEEELGEEEEEYPTYVPSRCPCIKQGDGGGGGGVGGGGGSCICCGRGGMLDNSSCLDCITFIHLQGTHILRMITAAESGSYWLALDGYHHDDGDSKPRDMAILRSLNARFKTHPSVLELPLVSDELPPPLVTAPETTGGGGAATREKKGGLSVSNDDAIPPKVAVVVYYEKGTQFDGGPCFNNGTERQDSVGGRGFEGVTIYVNRAFRRLELVQMFWYVS